MYWLPPGDCTAITYLIIHRKVYAYMDKTGNICFNFYLKTRYKKMQNKESLQTDAILRICFNFADASREQDFLKTFSVNFSSSEP